MLPFWSGASRLLKAQQAPPKFAAYEFKRLTLERARELLAKLNKLASTTGSNARGRVDTSHSLLRGAAACVTSLRSPSMN